MNSTNSGIFRLQPCGTMEIDDGECSSSGDERQEDLEQIRHSAVLDLDFDSEDAAQTIFRVVSVDKEPSRSNATRSFTVQGSHLRMYVYIFDCLDVRYAKRSVHTKTDQWAIRVHENNKTRDETNEPSENSLFLNS
ncbi:unnamed protein product [Strongylus vulgaris]|uniref:Uncharacterized protein n=1 Tax=Strongylus vulgaris TaxID=40348 RepID=A0A3P7JDB6_STRVU|nr:unnamed protein product [Strongylus vulgaris]